MDLGGNQFDVLVQAIRLEEADHSLGIVIVLVTRGLARLGLDEELPGKADLLGIGFGHLEQLCEVVEFPRHHRVDQGVEPLTSTPENKIFAAQPLGHLEHFLDGGSRVRKHVRVGTGARARHVPFVAKEVAGAPKQADARRLLQLLGNIHHCVQVSAALLIGGALRSYVSVMKSPLHLTPK